MSTIKQTNDEGIMAPLVSVITPAYNCAAYIRKTVESVAAQSFTAIEHILINDGSTDGTLELLHELKSEFPEIRVLSQQNQGAGVARNAGIQAAKGRYIAFLDSDDLWLPEKLDAQIHFMQTEGVHFSYGDYAEVEEGSGKVRVSFSLPEQLNYTQLLGGCPIGCLTVCYDQSVLGKKYMPLVRQGQDWGLWLALTRDGTIARKYPGNLAIYNYRQGSLSKNKLKKLGSIYRIYREEENIGSISSILHLYKHVRYAISKRQ